MGILLGSPDPPGNPAIISSVIWFILLFLLVKHEAFLYPSSSLCRRQPRLVEVMEMIMCGIPLGSGHVVSTVVSVGRSGKFRKHLLALVSDMSAAGWLITSKRLH